MNKLALGTVQFGLDYGVTNASGKVPLSEVEKILKLTRENDINTLDTASGYGDSEQVLGNVGVNGFDIVTKTTPLESGVGRVLHSFNQSLKHLKVSKVNGLLVHNMNDVELPQFETLYKELYALKQDGVINKIGFSTYTPEQVDFLLNYFDFDLIQAPFNVFDTRLLDGAQLRSLKNAGVEVHARSVFLQGLLLNFNDLPDYFLPWKSEFQHYQKNVKNSGLSLLKYALNFALETQEINKILIGVENVSQLREIVDSVERGRKLQAHPIADLSLLNPSLWRI